MTHTDFLNAASTMQCSNSLSIMDNAEKVYNAYTDSLFMSADLRVWKRRYETRQKLQVELYNKHIEAKTGLINVLQSRAGFECKQLHDTLTYQALMNDASLSASNLRLLLLKRCIQYYFFKDTYPFNDNQLLLATIQYLLPDFELYMPHSELTYVAYSMLSQLCAELQDYGGTKLTQQCVMYARKALDFEPRFGTFSDDALRFIYAQNYMGLLSKNPLVFGILTFDEGLEFMNQLLTLLQEHQTFFMSPELKAKSEVLDTKALSYPLNSMIDYVMPSAWSQQNDEMQHAAQKIIAVMEHDSSYFRAPDFYSYQMLKAYVGQKTLTQAWQESQAFLESHPFNFDVMTPGAVQPIFSSFKHLAFMCDSAHIDPKLKHQMMNSYADAFVIGVEHLTKFRQHELVASKIYEFFSTDRIRKHLNPQERRALFLKLQPYTLVDCYAPQCMVQQLSQVLLKAVADYRPDMLVGCAGIKSAREVKRSAVRQTLSDDMTLAVAVQDLGRNSVPSVFMNLYRPYTDVELSFLYTCPERSVKVLALTPSLKPVRDIVLGTNKWHNGASGYPDWFDNRLSAQRTLMDILAICNYIAYLDDGHGYQDWSSSLNFEKICTTLESESGTRFNDDLVPLILKHDDVKQAMKTIVDEEWAPLYYKAYSMYFNANHE